MDSNFMNHDWKFHNCLEREGEESSVFKGLNPIMSECLVENRIENRIQELVNFSNEGESLRSQIFQRKQEINLNKDRYERYKAYLAKQKKDGFSKAQEQLNQHKTILENQHREFEEIKRRWESYREKIYEGASQVQGEVLYHLEQFKRIQQLSGNGLPMENNLDRIQGWYESLINIWLNLLDQIDLMASQFDFYQGDPSNTAPGSSINSSEYYRSNIYHGWAKQVEEMIGNLVRSTFIVEKQPPQVLKKETRFQCTVRSLVGGNAHRTRPAIKVSIVNEAQARAIMSSTGTIDFKECSGAILNAEAHMENHPSNKYIASFRTLTLKRIQRTEKKGSESVMDEKFALLFQSTFKITRGELIYHVKALSLPVVVIVHGNQENHAWATVTWDNAFAPKGRQPFMVPERVPWGQVGQALNLKFKALVDSELNSDDLRFLAGKAFRNLDLAEYNNLLLSWGQFSKETLPDRNFTFWEWFYSILKLTRDHLKELWRQENRCIYGFVSRKQTEELLANKPEGTFLLRYSETELGSITIAYNTEMKSGDGKSVLMIKPWGPKDFQIRSLADRIRDLKHLKYLYPGTPKDDAFGSFYEQNTEIEPTCEGYVPPVLVTHIPEWAVSGNADSYPNTPHSSVITPSPTTDMYADPPNSVGSLPHDVPFNAAEISPFQDVDLYNMIDDVDYDMDDIPTELSDLAMNAMVTNGLNRFKND